MFLGGRASWNGVIRCPARRTPPYHPKENTMKAAIIILSDPKAGEDALGRMFNGLAAAYDFKQKQTEVGIYFQGAGTRWPGVLADDKHPIHALYKAVQDKVVGISCGCADVFGVREEAE